MRTTPRSPDRKDLKNIHVGLIGNPTVRLNDLRTCGFAPPPYDGFALKRRSYNTAIVSIARHVHDDREQLLACNLYN